MVDGNQAFHHDRSNKANTTFLKGLGSPVIYESLKRDSLLVYVLKYFRFFVGRCGSVGRKGETLGYERPGSRSRLNPGLRSSSFLIETLAIAGQTFKKGNLRRCRCY